MQNLTAAQKEDMLVGLATLALHDGGVEVTVRVFIHAAPVMQLVSCCPFHVMAQLSFLSHVVPAAGLSICLLAGFVLWPLSCISFPALATVLSSHRAVFSPLCRVPTPCPL